MTDEATGTKRIDQPGLATEEIPSLLDFYEEPSGNITPGWYAADILEGYATRNGKQWTTVDEPGKEGKRQFRLCFAIHTPSSVQNRQRTFFYAPGLFAPENLAHIKELRERFKGQRTWAGQGAAQHDSIMIGELSQLEKAIGFKLARHPNGGFLATPYISKKLDVRVATKNGFDEVTGFAQLGAMSGKAK